MKKIICTVMVICLLCGVGITASAACKGNTRQLENALGSREKFIAGNEQETCVIQRRCLRAARDIRAGETISRDMIDVLRPAVKGAVMPPEIGLVIGTKAVRDLKYGEELRWTDLISR